MLSAGCAATIKTKERKNKMQGQLSIFDFIEKKRERNTDWWQENVLGYPCSDCINYISKKVEYGTGCKFGIDARTCFCNKHVSKTKER